MDINRIFNSDSDSFEAIALEVFSYQFEHCEVYRDFVNHLDRPYPASLKEIPFLPIEFFKTDRVIDKNKTDQIAFKSSGTGGNRSSHFVADLSLYETSFIRAYQRFIGNPKDQVILALLPNYLEQGESSLVYMVDRLMKLSENPNSGYLLNDLAQIEERYQRGLKEGKRVVIFGVSYALLDLCEKRPNLKDAIIIETGGMKGRRKELTKAELHNELKNGLHVNSILSEYGMTELLSQAYSVHDGIFQSPNWMKIMIREPNDPFTFTPSGKTGGVNIIDLANLHSCSFIATQDLGRIHPNGFEIMGRFDHSDIRGCNLLVQ